jgi:hypothetical protein
MTDTITLLRAVSGARLTKKWLDDGTIAQYEDAKTFHAEEVPIASIDDLAGVLHGLRANSDQCVIRGAYPPGKRSRVQRNTESTWDQPHHWAMIDVDKFEPIADPVHDPAAACDEFIVVRLPPAFHDRTFYWQLSSSAGAPGREHLLKAHLWFWLEKPCDSPTLREWAKGIPGVDPAVFRQVQPHYTADPVMADGVADPVPKRGGLCRGMLDDVVPLDLGYRMPAAGELGPRDAGDVDIEKLKAPMAGYDLERVENEILAHLDPNCVYDDWLNVGMALHHQGEGDAEWLDLWDTWSSDGATWVEGGCEEHWSSFNGDRTVGTGAVTLGSLLKQVRPKAREVAQALQPGAGRADTLLAALAIKLGQQDIPWFEKAIEWDSAKFEDTLSRMAWDSTRSRFNVLSPGAAAMREFTDLQLGTSLRLLGLLGFYNASALEEIIEAAVQPLAAGMPPPPGSVIPPGGWTVAKVTEFKKETGGWFLHQLKTSCVTHRQFKDCAEVEDLFTKNGGLSIGGRRLLARFPMAKLPEGEIDQGVIQDFRQHFPQFDDFLALLVASRLASDRKQAYLWLHAESNWGKSFLCGQLERLGLVTAVSMDDLARAASGAPSGLTPERLRASWVLVVNEFKGVISEVKSIENELSFSPKNRPTVTVPLYLKLFMSAEDVPSLVGSETGADTQFVNRFMKMRGEGAIDARPLFAADKTAYARSVRNHIAAFVNSAVERARSVGEERAAVEADVSLGRLHGGYPLLAAGQGTLEQRLAELAGLFATDMVAYAGASTGASVMHRISKDNTFVKDGLVYLMRGEKALGQWLEASFTKAEAGKVQYKKRQILKLLPEAQSFRDAGGNVRKAIRLGTESDDPLLL